MAAILDLLLQCCQLGAIAEQAKIVEKCVSAIVDCWLISSKFSRRLEKDSKSADTGSFQKLCRLPLNWFMMLFTAARDKNVRPAVLASIVEMYVTEAMEQETKTKRKAEPQKDKTKQPDGEPEEADADADKEKEDEEKKEEVADIEAEANQPADEEQKMDLAAVLDALLPELPDNAPLAETISPQWAAKMLCTADSLGDTSRQRLVKLAGKVLHRFGNEELQQLSPELLCEVVEETTKDCEEGGGHPELVAMVIDNYLVPAGRRGQTDGGDLPEAGGGCTEGKQDQI